MKKDWPFLLIPHPSSLPHPSPLPSIALTASADDLVFNHGSAICLDLTQVTDAIAANGQEIETGQDNDPKQDQQRDDPKATVKVEETLLLRIEWPVLAACVGRFSLGNRAGSPVLRARKTGPRAPPAPP